jgi:hypothetical protein
VLSWILIFKKQVQHHKAHFLSFTLSSFVNFDFALHVHAKSKGLKHPTHLEKQQGEILACK